MNIAAKMLKATKTTLTAYSASAKQFYSQIGNQV